LGIGRGRQNAVVLTWWETWLFHALHDGFDGSMITRFQGITRITGTGPVASIIRYLRYPYIGVRCLQYRGDGLQKHDVRDVCYDGLSRIRVSAIGDCGPPPPQPPRQSGRHAAPRFRAAPDPRRHHGGHRGGQRPGRARAAARPAGQDAPGENRGSSTRLDPRGLAGCTPRSSLVR
jgi:hypothetical protein